MSSTFPFGEGNYGIRSFANDINAYILTTPELEGQHPLISMNSADESQLTDEIKYTVLKLCTRKRTVLCFENIMGLEHSLLLYICDLIKMILTYYSRLNTFVLMGSIRTVGKESVFLTGDEASVFHYPGFCIHSFPAPGVSADEGLFLCLLP